MPAADQSRPRYVTLSDDTVERMLVLQGVSPVRRMVTREGRIVGKSHVDLMMESADLNVLALAVKFLHPDLLGNLISIP